MWERFKKCLKLPWSKPSTVLPLKDDGSPDDCTICLEPLDEDAIRGISCNHYFHKHCQKRWLIQQNSCPLCKKKLVKKPIKTEEEIREDMMRRVFGSPFIGETLIFADMNNPSQIIFIQQEDAPYIVEFMVKREVERLLSSE